MTKADKREQKIHENTRNVSLEDFEWLIQRYGHIKVGGSHPEAIIGRESYPYPKTNPVHPVYVKDLLKLIDMNKEGKK